MGLLDQIIGQVVGQMAGGGAQAAPPRRGGPAGGAPTGPAPGGGIGDILGQLGGAGGKYSPLVLALLALLASKHLSTGAGGYGSVLRDMFDRITGRGGAARDGGLEEEPELAPEPRGRIGRGRPDEREDEFEPEELARPRRRSGGSGRQDEGDFLDSVGSMLDGGSAGGGARRRVSGEEPWGADPDGAPGGMPGGLGGLFDRFSRRGHEDAMRSWVEPGPNRPIAPGDLDQALGPEIVDQLSRGTGMDRDQLLAQLSHALPEVVDRLTPEGRLPREDEEARWV